MKLQGSGVLITGASRGLGRALALELAGKGARVVLVARGGGALREVEQEIRKRGGQAFTIEADVADKNRVYEIAALAQQYAGPISAVVHAASSLGPVPLRALADTDCEDLEAVLAANLVGPFRLTKALLGSMQLRGDGIVMSISSDAAVEAYPTWGAYSVSKIALDHLMRVWSAESPAVQFLSLDPGEMDTQMHADAIPDADRSTLQRPEDVARKVVRVLESASNWKSGARILASAVLL